jgi:hypothetical protein
MFIDFAAKFLFKLNLGYFTIKARAMLQQLSARIVKYQAHAIKIRETLSPPMEQQIFSYDNTCDDLFIN